MNQGTRSNFIGGHQFAHHGFHGGGLVAAAGVCFLIVVLLLASSLIEAAASTERFSFYAVYDRVSDMQSLDLEEIHNSLMSADGQKLVVYGRSRITGKTALYILNTDGSDVQTVPIPESLDIIGGATVNSDGSRVFLRHHWDKAIYKLEFGEVSKIFDADDFKTVNGCDQIQTTADGEWVYFRDLQQGICRVSHLGGDPEHVIYDRDVTRDSGRAANTSQFCISADGRALAFIINGYWDERGVFHDKHEVFVMVDGHIRQLTNDDRHVFKSRLAISGDGRVIAYTALMPQNRMWVVYADGTGKRQLDSIGDVGNVALNHDGSKLFYYDTLANGGRLAYTDGSGGVDLFPLYNVRAIALHATWSLATSESGNLISFRFQDGVYVGHLDRPDTVQDAPVIHEIQFEPPVTDMETVGAGTNLYARISDPEGLDDIIRTNTNQLIAGHTEGNSQKVPIYFYNPVNDAGASPDISAGDGVFSSAGRTGGAPEDVLNTRIRVAVMDRSYTVVVADADLSGAVAAPIADEPAIVEAMPGTDVPATPSEPGEVTPQRSLSPEQRRILQRYGPPDAFEMAREPYAEVPERMFISESWRYFDYLTSFEFIDGELLDAVQIEAVPDNTLAASQYSPESFYIGMRLEDVRNLLGDADLASSDLPERFGEGLEIYTGDQILLGFADGVLEYVVTFALTVGVEEKP